MTMPELFHAIDDEESATVRRFVVTHDLADRVRFRNVTYAEVQVDLAARGGARTPALWDGERLVDGEDAVVEALRKLIVGG